MIYALEQEPVRQGWIVHFALENMEDAQRRSALAQHLFEQLSLRAWRASPEPLKQAIYMALAKRNDQLIF